MQLTAAHHTVASLPATITPRVVPTTRVGSVPGLSNDWATQHVLADLDVARDGGDVLPMPGDLASWYGGRGDGISAYDWSHPQFRRVEGSFEDALAGAANWSSRPAGEQMQGAAQAVLRGEDGKHYLAAIGAPSDLRAFWPYWSGRSKWYVWQTQHLPSVGQLVQSRLPQLEAIVDGDRYVDLRD